MSVEPGECKLAVLTVKVVPGSSRDCIAGWLEGSLKVKIQAPPEKGKANRSLIKNLAKWLAVEPRAVKLKSGNNSALKTFVISGLNQSELQQRIVRVMKQ